MDSNLFKSISAVMEAQDESERIFNQVSERLHWKEIIAATQEVEARYPDFFPTLYHLFVQKLNEIVSTTADLCHDFQRTPESVFTALIDELRLRVVCMIDSSVEHYKLIQKREEEGKTTPKDAGER